MADEVDIGSLISRTPGVCGGRPCIAGTRMTVGGIAVMHQMGRIPEEIVNSFGHISLAQVHAALAYYYANKEQIDADLEAEDRLHDALARQYGRARQCG